jgi:hypothetical protein
MFLINGFIKWWGGWQWGAVSLPFNVLLAGIFTTTQSCYIIKLEDSSEKK